MSNAPSIFLCIDGIDGVGKTTVCRHVSAVMEIPVVRAGRDMLGLPWPNEIREKNDSLVMTIVHQLNDYLPSVVFDRSMVSTCAYNEWAWNSFGSYPWEIYYPKDRTVFIVLVDDIERTIKSEGLDVYRPLMIQRIQEQRRFVILARYLGEMGYRTNVISASGGAVATGHKVIEYARAVQMDIMEAWKREGMSDDA